jgi:uncharacterized LabA/DUF88 family protein
MIKTENNYAYIDGANLHKGIKDLGWELDYARFRIWLTEKYHVGRAYLFIGLMPRRKDLYTSLQEAGFTLVFKEITYDGHGNVKGNCDADLVLAAVCDSYENSCDKMILVSCDGDYAGLVKFLLDKNKFKIILSPNNKSKLSILLKRTNAPIAYLDNQKVILGAQKEKAPNADGTA